MYMMENSFVSLTGVMVLVIAAYLFVPTKLSRKRRVVIGVLHVSAHMTAALVLMLLLELGIEICIRNRLLATSGILLLFECFFPSCYCLYPSWNIGLFAYAFLVCNF